MGIITVTLNSGCHTEQDSAFMMTLSILNESLPFRTDHCHSERSEESGSHYQYEQNRNMIIKELNGKVPSTGEGTFIAENAALIGDVVTGRNCSIWYGAVLRGDVGPIKLGDNVNIQDCAVLHATTDFSEVVILTGLSSLQVPLCLKTKCLNQASGQGFRRRKSRMHQTASPPWHTITPCIILNTRNGINDTAPVKRL